MKNAEYLRSLKLKEKNSWNDVDQSQIILVLKLHEVRSHVYNLCV